VDEERLGGEPVANRTARATAFAPHDATLLTEGTPARAANPDCVAGFDEARDATRRTRLANERTYLAWWRTGLTTLAVSVGAGRLVPELSGGPKWPFELIGVAFAIVGIAFVIYGYLRYRDVDEALSRGEYAGLPGRGAVVFAGLGALLGLATVLLVLLHPK
jgi:putative membrane protein